MAQTTCFQIPKKRGMLGALNQPLIPQSVHTSRVAHPWVQHPALSLIELHMTGDCLFLICQSLSAGFCTLNNTLMATVCFLKSNILPEKEQQIHV